MIDRLYDIIFRWKDKVGHAKAHMTSYRNSRVKLASIDTIESCIEELEKLFGKELLEYKRSLGKDLYICLKVASGEHCEDAGMDEDEEDWCPHARPHAYIHGQCFNTIDGGEEWDGCPICVKYKNEIFDDNDFEL
jgi:hypothetical protein